MDRSFTSETRTEFVEVSGSRNVDTTSVVVSTGVSGIADDVIRTNKRLVRNVNFTLLAVIVGWSICITPNQLFFAIYNLGVPLTIYGRLHNSTIVMMLLNCCINPMIYMLKYEIFRRGVFDILKYFIRMIKSSLSCNR